ncbi:MAG: DNA translocase FtsK 4TM domain-containing protein [Eubacteriales bacterium]|nr:DNA translocase FtsK 4TM domain-containing protein [Eubacteriales bacterium]
MAQKKSTSSTARKTSSSKSRGTKATGARKTSKSSGSRTSKSTKSSKSRSSKSSRNSKAKKSAAAKDEAVCLIALALCIVALVSLFTDKMGIAGETISGFLKGLFGLGGYFLPFIAASFSLWMLFSEERRGIGMKVGAGLLFIVSIASFAQAITTTGQGTVTAAKLFADGSAANGGLVGGAIGGVLIKLFDKLGTYIILSVLIIVSVVMGTGASFFDGVGSAAKYVGDTGKRHDERVKVKAERIKEKQNLRQIKTEEKEMRREERAERVRKRKEVFNILMDKTDFDAKETGGFADEGESIELIDSENVPEAFPGGVMPSDYMVRNIARHNGTAVPEMDITNSDAESVVEFNKERGIQCVISNGDYDDDEEPEGEIEINFGVPHKAELEEVSDEEIEREGLEIEAVSDEHIITEGASKEGYMPDIKAETPKNMKNDNAENAEKETEAEDKSGIIGGQIYTDDEMKTVMGLSGAVDTREVKSVRTDYEFPPISLLAKAPVSGEDSSKAYMLATAKKLEDTLKSFGVDARVMQINKGPTVTRYEVSPSHGVKVSKIVNLADDIALNLAASGIRIEAPIPGKAAVGIEVPNKEPQSVYLRTVLESEQFKNFPSKLAFALGQDIAGNAVVTDIAKMPHLLIAGATGSGKSVCINTLITSIIYKAKPDEVKLILVDPKVVELSVYNGIPHLMIPVVTDPKKAAGALNWAVREMLARYNSFAECSVRDIKGYNAMKADKGEIDFMPQIVIIIDELADLMMAAPKEVEDSICRLAQMARAAGIHLIIATQRPSVDVITGVIKANIPSRLAFAVSSGIDSRTILDMNGAEKLLGKGDMLFYPVGMAKPVRIQGAFVTDKEVENIVDFLKKQSGGSEYNENVMEEISSSVKTGGASEERDEFFDSAAMLVAQKEKASVSMLQRQFRIGYNRAARLMDELEAAGIVGPEDGSKPRKVLVTPAQLEQGRE